MQLARSTYVSERLAHEGNIGGQIATLAGVVALPEVFACVTESKTPWDYALELNANFRLAMDGCNTPHRQSLHSQQQAVHAKLTPLERTLIWSVQLLAMSRATEARPADLGFARWYAAARGYARDLAVVARFSKLPYQGITLWVQSYYEMLRAITPLQRMTFWQTVYDARSPLVNLSGRTLIAKKQPHEIVKGWLVPFMPESRIARGFEPRLHELEKLTQELNLKFSS